MKELESKLASLKEITMPEQSFREKNREILLSQVYGSDAGTASFNWMEEALMRLPAQFLRAIPQPMVAVLVVMGFLTAGGAWSVGASRETKPGDSLYVAKIVSERAQLAVTFDEKAKLDLRLGFASNRAEEITKVLEQSEGDQKASDEKVSSLMTDMRAEIDEVKKQITPKVAVVADTEAKKPAAPKEIKKPTTTPAKSAEKTVAKEEDSHLMSAKSGKDNKGISTSEQEKKELEIKIEKVAPRIETPKEIIDMAKDSLKNDDYDTTMGLLNKLDSAVEESVKADDKGEVKGETASSTEK